mmetsp:Transcript_36163/g.86938  ORF Transcript_36163/g.86938 Transcript_36163/m.86938 type:complete len:109 (-) Transcript_36163:4948-5274(-)
MLGCSLWGGSRRYFCTCLRCHQKLLVGCGTFGWSKEVSRSFFRTATAILYLSQPTLLNYELEGMMMYLNTIPDATLLRPDILIPCALNIKVTNRMLEELESSVMAEAC